MPCCVLAVFALAALRRGTATMLGRDVSDGRTALPQTARRAAPSLARRPAPSREVARA